MNNILKKLTAMLTAVVMIISLAPIAFAGVEYSVEDAYEECAAQYPGFVDAVLSNGATEKQIVSFLGDLQEYLLSLDVEITEENFEEYFIEAINQTMAKRRHIKVRDALVAAFPEAAVDGMDGIIAPEFEPLVETIKDIIFANNMLEEETTEEETTEEETEPTTEKPSEEATEPSEEATEPSEKPSEESTEPETEPATKPVEGGNEGGFEDEGEETTLPDEKPTTPSKPKLTFTDMNQAPWAEKAVYSLVESGVLNGYPDGTFKPNNPVTRAEFAKMITLASGRYKDSEKATYVSKFTDVAATAWEYPYVSAALKFGFITGRSETIFDPNSNITRGDLCLIVYRYIKSVNPEFKAKTNADGTPITFSDAANVPSWDVEAVNVLYSNSIASLRDTVNNKFEPTLPATRAECAQIIYNASRAALGLPIE